MPSWAAWCGTSLISTVGDKKNAVVKLNFACMRLAGSAFVPSLCEYYDLLVNTMISKWILQSLLLLKRVKHQLTKPNGHDHSFFYLLVNTMIWKWMQWALSEYDDLYVNTSIFKWIPPTYRHGRDLEHFSLMVVLSDLGHQPLGSRQFEVTWMTFKIAFLN